MWIIGTLIAVVLAAPAWCQRTLADASLEQLLDTPVTSVSRKEQKLARTAAAVFVINHDDIRHSGATSLPDLLRMVPGVDVGQIDANAWAISIRGFNGRYSSKLLVLVDGRSVYTSSFSGVYWDQLDMAIEDIERIEVVRGPGATVWGANAVNGVINIITKSSKATKEGLAAVTAGSEVQPAGMLRYGDDVGSSGTYRAFAKYYRTAHTTLPGGSPAYDASSRVHGGFRSDWALSPRDSFTVEGDLFSNRGGHTRIRWFQPTPNERSYNEPNSSLGGDLLATWTHTSSTGSETSIRGYFDAYRRNDIATIEVMKALDLEFQNRFSAGARHDIIWGGGMRATNSGVNGGGQVQLSPPFRTDRVYSLFLQDEIALTNTLWLTLGSKIEHNPMTGFEYEPSARITWTPTPRSALWASSSRAIRQPSRQETGVAVHLSELPIDPYTVVDVRLYGNPLFQSEELRDLEFGYRAAWTRQLSFDMDVFLSSYRHLSTYEAQPQIVHTGAYPLRVEVPLVYGNLGRASSHGAEASLTWDTCSRWRLSFGYAWLNLDHTLEPRSTDELTHNLALDTPPQSFQVRSLWKMARRLEWGQSLYWTSKLAGNDVPAHARLDTRFAWRVGERTEISLVGQNLLRPRSLEFNRGFQIVESQVQRSVFGKITWTF